MLFLALACTPPDSDSAQPTPNDSDTPSTVLDDTAVDTDVVDTDVEDTDLPFVPVQADCPTLPPLPETFTAIPGLGPHEDFAFDATGGLVGVGGSGNLVSNTRDGQTTLLAPNLGEAKGTQFLADGSIVVAQPALGTIARVTPDGQTTVLASVTASNGIAADLHGNAWIATANGRVERITPTGERTVAAEVPGTLDGIAFSPDYTRLYFNSEFGVVRMIDVLDGEVDSEPMHFADVPLGISILDGMTADSCGNLYVSRMDGRIFRFAPDGTQNGVIGFQNHPGAQITPAINFGSGVGGFERDRLYAMNFLGGVLEADVGIEGRWEPHFDVPQ